MDYFTQISFGDAYLSEDITQPILDQFAAYGYEVSEYVRDGGDIYWCSEGPVPDEVWLGMQEDGANPVLSYRTWQTSLEPPQWYTKISFGASIEDDWIELVDQNFANYSIDATLVERDDSEATWAVSAVAGCAAWDDLVNDGTGIVVAYKQWC